MIAGLVVAAMLQVAVAPAPLPITLPEAIAVAIDNNQDLVARGIEHQIAQFNLRAARGAYEPQLDLLAERQRSVTPVASLIGGGGDGRLTQSLLAATPAVSGLMPWLGGSYAVEFDAARLDTNNLFATLNPQYTSQMTVQLNQPLLEGLGFDEPRHRIEVARVTVERTLEEFRTTLMDTVYDIVRQYWELAYAMQYVGLQEEAVRLATEQMESNRRAVDAGILAPIAIVEAEAQVATFQSALEAARELRARTENALKMLLGFSAGDPAWNAALVPVSPPDARPVDAVVGDAVQAALARRPELAELELTRRIQTVDTRLLRNRTLPQLDIIAAYSLAGLAGRQVDRRDTGIPVPPVFDATLPPELIGGFNRSLANLFGTDFPTTRIGIQLSLPFFNRIDEANLGAALAEERRLEAQQRALATRIEAEVRSALAAAATSRDRIAAAERAANAALEQYESENRRMQSGLSTVFLVLQRQTQLVDARTRLIRARADHARALAELDRAAGRILDVHGVQVNSTLP